MRLFVAIKLNSEVTKELSRFQEFVSKKTSRFDPSKVINNIALDNFHLTVQFLGEVKVEELQKIKASLHGVAKRIKPFSLTLGTHGCLPAKGNVRVLWAGLKHEEQIFQCIKMVHHELGLIGFPPEEKEVTAHITVAKVKEAIHGIDLRTLVMSHSLHPVAIPVSTLTLMDSSPGKMGSHYHVVEEFPLKA